MQYFFASCLMIGRSFISLIPRSLKIASGRKFFCSLPGDREILHFDDPLQARDHLIQDDNAIGMMRGEETAGHGRII